MTETATPAAPALRELLRAHLHPSPYNPASRWENPDPELAASIKAQGIIEPVIVRPRGAGGYEIIAGHRRVAAAHLAGLEKIPAIVRNLSPAEAAEIQLVENDQREDLSPLARANLYASYLQATKRTQAQLAQGIGRTEGHVSQVLSILQLPKSAIKLIDTGKVDFTAARELVKLVPYPKRLDGVLTNIGYGDARTVKEVKREVEWALEDEARENAQLKAQEQAKAQAATARTKTKADKKAAAEAKRQRELEAKRLAKADRDRAREMAVDEEIENVLQERATSYANAIAAHRKKIQLPPALLAAIDGYLEDLSWELERAGTSYGELLGRILLPKLPGKWKKTGMPVNDAARLSELALISWAFANAKTLDNQLEKAGDARGDAAAKAKPKQGASQ